MDGTVLLVNHDSSSLVLDLFVSGSISGISGSSGSISGSSGSSSGSSGSISSGSSLVVS